jgi:glutamate/tyrosine decarboxylase-like PLP-dependent enzyme
MSEVYRHLALQRAFELAVSFLDEFDRKPVAEAVNLEDLRRSLGRPLGNEPCAPEVVIAELARDVEGAIVRSAGGRFFGWVIGGGLPAAIAADWLTTVWDQNAVLYGAGPAAAVVEEVVGEWIKEILGLPADASFALVTGTQMAHFTCLAAARHAVLERCGWDVEQSGLYGAPPMRILCSDHHHGSIERAARYLGFGKAQITRVETDSLNRMKPDSLDQAIGRCGSAPTIVVLQAGDICTGAFDEFETVIPLAKRRNTWVHVDGAFGLWAAASPKYRHLLKGVERADSWTTDGHKWLNVPFDCGFAFVASPEAHRDSMSHRAPYLTHDEHARDPMDWTPEWSRRARGFSSYAALRQLGRAGLRSLIERSCGHTRHLVSELARLPGVLVLSEPVLNQALVRFEDPRPNASPADHDRRTDSIISAVVASGEAFFTATTWKGTRAMRVSVSNWRTTSKDIERTVSAFAKALGAGTVDHQNDAERSRGPFIAEGI